MKQKISILFVWAIANTFGYAQNVVNVSGASISNATLIVEYSIGEIVTTTIQNAQIAGTQGLLQPTYQIVSAVNEEFDILYLFNAYPNPLSTQLNVETDYPNFKKVEVFNFAGQKVAEKDFDGNPILLSDLSTGTYLFCFRSEQFTKSIKIIKK